VPDELFEAVQAQIAGRAHSKRQDNIGVHVRPKYLLSGLLKCGACGSGMSRMGEDKSDRTRIRCSGHTNSGACADQKTFYADEVEELAIDSLANELATPDRIKVYAERYIKARIEQGGHEKRRRAEIEARISAIAKDNDLLLDLLMAGKGDQDAVDARDEGTGPGAGRPKN
jgi:site-specific DNA recombinase